MSKSKRQAETLAFFDYYTRYPIPVNKNILRISEAQNCSFLKNIEAHSNF